MFYYDTYMYIILKLTLDLTEATASPWCQWSPSFCLCLVQNKLSPDHCLHQRPVTMATDHMCTMISKVFHNHHIKVI